MCEAAQTYWDEYWKDAEKPALVSACMFGVSPDELAQLVIDEYSIILNGQEEPVAIIKIVDVSIVPMNEVSEEFAVAEGEGPYEAWNSAHVEFFTSELQEVGLEFSEDMLLVCERFKLVDVKEM